jgi:hypothetical protein
MKILDTVCSCGKRIGAIWSLDKHGVPWYWCSDCGWWYMKDWEDA